MGGESRPWEGSQEAREQSGHSELWGGSGQGGFARGLWFLLLSWSSGCWGRSRENPGLEPLTPCNAELATGAPPHSERFLSLALPEEMRVGEKRGLEGQEGLGGGVLGGPVGHVAQLCAGGPHGSLAVAALCV